MFSILLMVVLMGSLPTLTHSLAPIASVTQLYANETASQHLEANYKDSWLGWVSISWGCHSFLTALGCMACLGSIKFVSRLSGCVEHVLSHDTDWKDCTHCKLCDRVLIHTIIAGRPPMLRLIARMWQIFNHSADKHFRQVWALRPLS